MEPRGRTSKRLLSVAQGSESFRARDIGEKGSLKSCREGKIRWQFLVGWGIVAGARHVVSRLLSLAARVRED